MKIDPVGGTVGNVMVMTTNNRGYNAEELAEMALGKILAVSSTAHPLLAQQAEAYRERIRTVLVHYLNEAKRSERVTLAAHLDRIGYGDLAPYVNP